MLNVSCWLCKMLVMSWVKALEGRVLNEPPIALLHCIVYSERCTRIYQNITLRGVKGVAASTNTWHCKWCKIYLQVLTRSIVSG